MKQYISIFKEKSNIPQEILDKFGKILFGSFRDKDEKDTSYEKDIFKNIQDWVKGSHMGTGKTRDISKIFNELKKIRDLYPEVLKSTVTTYYRLIEIDVNTIKNDVFKFENINNRWYSKKFYTYEPFKSVQSWTTSEGTAFGFLSKPVGIALNKSISRNFAINVVIQANLNNDNVLFNPSFLNAVAYDQIGMKQNEIIHLSKEPIKVKYILNKETMINILSYYTPDALKNKKFNYLGKDCIILGRSRKNRNNIIAQYEDNKKIVIRRWISEFIKGNLKAI